MQEDEILATWSPTACASLPGKRPIWVKTIKSTRRCGDQPHHHRPRVLRHILAVGKKWQHKFQPGQRYVFRPTCNCRIARTAPATPSRGGRRSHACGYSQRGHGTRLPVAYDGETYFEGSLVEPLSCVLARSTPTIIFRKVVITTRWGSPARAHADPRRHRTNGTVGVDYALHGPVNPSLLVITDTDTTN